MPEVPENQTRFAVLRRLFLSMIKVGAFTFGGGYAMIPLLQEEFVSRKKWLEEQEFLDVVAIAESTPGPIAINSATYIGYRTAGVLGSAVATVAMCIPSFVIIYLISLFLDQFLALTLVARAFRGIQVCVVYLILSAGLRMLKGIRKDPLSLILLGGTFVCMVVFSLFALSFSAVFYILISGAISLLVYAVTKCRKEGKS